MSSGNATPSTKSQVLYAPPDVPDGHWSITELTPKDAHYVASILVDQQHVILVKLNPTDSRAYRSLVVFTQPESIRKTAALNRPYSLGEMLALYKVVALMQQTYERLGLIAQSEVAGNNAHAFDATTRTTLIGGNKQEPSFLHAHVLGRGDPQATVVGSVPLRGPEPGQLFNMREGKTKWDDGEMQQVRDAVQKGLFAVILDHARQGGAQLQEFRGGDAPTRDHLAGVFFKAKYAC